MELKRNFALKGMVMAGSMAAIALTANANGPETNLDNFQTLGSGSEVRADLLNKSGENLLASLELKCGSKDKAEMEKKESKDAKATESKTKEGKCGEGKCGDKEKKAEHKSDTTKSFESKSKDHKCGEGKCGN